MYGATNILILINIFDFMRAFLPVPLKRKPVRPYPEVLFAINQLSNIFFHCPLYRAAATTFKNCIN